MFANSLILNDNLKKVSEYNEIVDDVKTCLTNVQDTYLQVASYLRIVKNKELWSVGEYNSFYEFAKNEFDLSSTTVKNMLSILDRFCDNIDDPYEVCFKEEFENFKFSQLVELLTVPEEKLLNFTPDLSIREIRNLKIIDNINKDTFDLINYFKQIISNKFPKTTFKFLNERILEFKIENIVFNLSIFDWNKSELSLRLTSACYGFSDLITKDLSNLDDVLLNIEKFIFNKKNTNNEKSNSVKVNSFTIKDCINKFYLNEKYELIPIKDFLKKEIDVENIFSLFGLNNYLKNSNYVYYKKSRIGDNNPFSPFIYELSLFRSDESIKIFKSDSSIDFAISNKLTNFKYIKIDPIKYFNRFIIDNLWCLMRMY